MAALEDAGRLPGREYKGATMYTTLSPCDMCSGACYFYGISRVVLGENKTRLGAESYLKEKGIEVINMQNKGCQEMMKKFIQQYPEIW
jgi:creatinine deaminase